MQENDRDGFWDIDKLVPKKNTTLAGFSTKEKTEKELVGKFKTLFASSGTERVDTGDADDSAEIVSYTDGIGEV